MEGLSILSILRIIVYLWVAVEFANLAFLYFEGYRNVKTTPIIKALQTTFLILSIQFFVFAFLPLLFDINKEVHAIIVNYLPIILVPVGFAVRRFRCESLRKQTMNLPKNIEKE